MTKVDTNEKINWDEILDNLEKRMSEPLPEPVFLVDYQTWEQLKKYGYIK